MEAKLAKPLEQGNSFDIFTSDISTVEISDDHQRAILIVPLMHVGANKKGLYWTSSMLKKIASMFKGVPFRYDLDGKEGSSHTLNKLSSPHFDVGWTYSSDEGAWYDDKTKSMWVKGEVTHPDVISKLSRKTSDGKREVNFASMGVVVEKAECSICRSDFVGNECNKGHVRNQKYDNKICYKIPTEVSKALHVALTNDPADGEAEIRNVLIQEFGYEAAPQDKRGQAGEQMERNQLSDQTPGGLAISSPQTAQPGIAPSSDDILRDLAERIKTIEQKISAEAMKQGTAELVNSSPQDQFTQSNMGNTTQFEAQKQPEENKMEKKDAQYTNEKTSVNPKEPEVQESEMVANSPMQKVMDLLQQILQRLPGAETQDMGKEALDANKGNAEKTQEDLPTEHMGPGESVKDSTEEGNKKNKAAMTKPDRVENADDAEVNTLKKEFADLKEQMKNMRSKMEIQDNDLPEFGGSQPNNQKVDVADMTPNERREHFGEYGSWDSIFNGANSAQRFKR